MGFGSLCDLRLGRKRTRSLRRDPLRGTSLWETRVHRDPAPKGVAVPGRPPKSLRSASPSRLLSHFSWVTSSNHALGLIHLHFQVFLIRREVLTDEQATQGLECTRTTRATCDGRRINRFKP